MYQFSKMLFEHCDVCSRAYLKYQTVWAMAKVYGKSIGYGRKEVPDSVFQKLDNPDLLCDVHIEGHVYRKQCKNGCQVKKSYKPKQLTPPF